MKPQTAEAMRKSELAVIHIAKKQLALDDDAYRSIMLSVAGKQSAAELDGIGRRKLLDHFKKIGFKSAQHLRPAVADGRKAQIGKIEAQLAEAKRPWRYADAMAKRICKVDGIRFCTPENLGKIIAALSYDAKRNGRNEE